MFLLLRFRAAGLELVLNIVRSKFKNAEARNEKTLRDDIILKTPSRICTNIVGKTKNLYFMFTEMIINTNKSTVGLAQFH